MRDFADVLIIEFKCTPVDAGAVEFPFELAVGFRVLLNALDDVADVETERSVPDNACIDIFQLHIAHNHAPLQIGQR